MKHLSLAMVGAIAVLAGCPTTPKPPTTVKVASPKPTKPAVATAPSPTAAASRAPRPTLPPVSFPPVLVPSPPPSPEGLQVSTIAGQPKAPEFADGPGAAARFSTPDGLAVGPDGNLYVADEGNHRIRKVDLHDPAFAVTTAVGGGVKPSKGGILAGKATEVYLRRPLGVAFLPDGRMVFTDLDDHAVKVVGADGQVTAYAGSGDDGLQDGPAATARFGWPTAIAVGKDGTAYVTDARFNRIRAITPDGQVKTLAGSGEPNDLKKDGPFLADGPAAKAIFSNMYGIAVDAAGTVFVADGGNSQLRKLKDGVVTTTAGSGEGYSDGFWRDVQLCGPAGIALDPAGNIVIADAVNHRIRRSTPLGDVVTLAGSGGYCDASKPGDHADGPAASARFDNPFGVAVAPDGTIYVSDQHNHCIRKLSR